nr:MAG TPA: hypothetical protein [Caudoviricetes sp.]
MNPIISFTFYAWFILMAPSACRTDDPCGGSVRSPRRKRAVSSPARNCPGRCMHLSNR